jgi:hypothetical protein
MLDAIFDYAKAHPGFLHAALSDEAVIDAEGAQAVPLLQQWGNDWAEILLAAAASGQVERSYDMEIVGQVIVGAIHQASSEAARTGRTRATVVHNLTRFLVRALKP